MAFDGPYLGHVMRVGIRPSFVTVPDFFDTRPAALQVVNVRGCKDRYALETKAARA
jgi:hypothetical protein